MGDPVVAQPIADSETTNEDLSKLKEVKVEEKEVKPVSGHQLFPVSDGESFEDQAGFLGRW